MRKFAVADCETLPFKKKRLITEAYIWEFWDGETRFVTKSTEEFIEYLRDYDGIVYAHNGGKFDWHFVLPYLTPYDNLMIINGRIAKANLGKCELRDSFNIIPVPLSAYKKDDFDYTILEEDQREKPANQKKIRKYLHNDCVYLYELVERFLKDYGLHLTQAGAAMFMWRQISERAAPKTDDIYYEEFSRFYFGGRVECLEAGIIEGRFEKYDINSAYPEAMLHKHPYTDNVVEEDGYVEKADFFDLVCVSDGCLPWRDHHGALTFPRDSVRREYHVTKWELQAGLDTDTLHNVEFIRSYTFVDQVSFADYIEYFRKQRWECKEKGDEAGSLFAKLFMNSLYGKFSANPARYKENMIVPMDVVCGLPRAGWDFAGEFGPWALAERDLPEARRRYYNVATGASITGYVRAKIWRGICSATRPIYVDTDAITCEVAGDSMEIGDALGQWKLEGVFDKLGIGGKKLYIMRGASGWWSDENGKTVNQKEKPKNGERLYATAHKGVKLTHSQLWRVARGGTVEYESISPTFSVRKKQTFTKRKVKQTTCK